MLGLLPHLRCLALSSITHLFRYIERCGSLRQLIADAFTVSRYLVLSFSNITRAHQVLPALPSLNRTSVYRTLKGMEAMHSLRKGQGAMFAYGQPNPDAVIVNRVFETA